MTDSLYTAAVLIDILGYPPSAVVIVGAGAGLLSLIERKYALAIIYSSVLAWTASGLLKLLFAIPRPDSALIEVAGYRFPSWHALFAAAFFGSLCFSVFSVTRSVFLRTITAAACTAAVVVVGWSRVFLGVHVPLDVIVGSLLGIIVALPVHFFVIRKGAKRSLTPKFSRDRRQA